MSLFGKIFGEAKEEVSAVAAGAKQMVTNAAHAVTNTINMEKINLAKDVVINLKKNKGIENQVAQVVLCLDISGSMSSMYSNGEVQSILERVTPIAMGFDDDQAFQLYLFENNCKRHDNDVDINNLGGFIKREVLGHYDFGGTSYAPAIKMIVNDYKKNTPITPVYVVFITDGENSDHSATESALIEASKYGIFFQFVGIGNSSFSFLEELDNMSGRVIDNANFFSLNDFNKVTDKDLYGRLLNEFPGWLELARKQNQIN